MPHATEAARRAILGAMKAVAATGGTPSTLDQQAIAGAARFVFGMPGGFDADALPALGPEALANALPSNLADDAVRFLTVMTLVDGTLDKAKVAAVVRYAAALGIHERFLGDMVAAARDRLGEALADMTRANMESITGKPWAGGDVTRWLVPYADGHADPALAARFDALSALPVASFGHSFWTHFRESGYAFPGNPAALNAAFSLPHDSAHVLTGYDTTPRGEILVSTFTASMHKILPMAGHVLPVLLTWHVGVRLNDVAGDAHDTLDPTEFWHAWAAGAAATVDTFAPDWDFWRYVNEPLVALRERWSIPIGGVEAS
ncbi:MAG: hypothetical protein ACREF1_02625 [Acetobacteraceae bacterium]